MGVHTTSAPVPARIPPGRSPTSGRYRRPVDSRSCVVVEGDERWPGTVLAWQRSETGWRGLVRFSRVGREGYSLVYEHWLSADVLEPQEPD
jgi:hypothetical protein